MHSLILLFRSSGFITTLAVQLASIKEHLRGDYKLTVVVTGERGSLDNNVCVYLNNLDKKINVKYLDDVIHSEPDTLISMNVCSNKLPTIIFSSSVIISRDINVSLLGGGVFSACASNGFNNLESDQNIWQSLYAKSGIHNRGMCLTTRIGGRIVPPIFEMDIIVTNNAKKLAKHWRSMHKITITHEALKSKPVLAWKFSLGLAVMMANYKYTLIREDCSYPIDFKPLKNRVLPSVFIYKNTESLCSERAIRKLFHDLTIDNKPLEEMINNDKSWSPVLKVFNKHLDQNEITSSQLKKQKSFIVDGALTGIPRSGTSYLVALLNKTKRAVVINEPSEVNIPLANEIIPWTVSRYYREIRRRIDYGEPIENRMKDGVHIEDTLINNQKELYLPSLNTSDYSLFTKSTLPFLVRIKELKRAIPGLVMVASIRNPYDTIASWKTSFDHLKNASVKNMIVGNPDDPYLPGIQKSYLSLIDKTDLVEVRRALYWKYLAETILNYKDDLIIIRYEELVTNPMENIETILRSTGMSNINLKPDDYLASEPRSKRSVLTTTDKQAISLLCEDVAAELGYTKEELDG